MNRYIKKNIKKIIGSDLTEKIAGIKNTYIHKKLSQYDKAQEKRISKSNEMKHQVPEVDLINLASFDIVILSAVKDYNKLKFLLDSLPNIIQSPKNIYVISPDNNVPKFDNVIYKTDSEVLNIDRSVFKYRPNHIFQQFLKLFQDFTECDTYLVVDSDIIFNKPISMYENHKPVLYFSNDQYYKPYFNFSKAIFNLDKEFKHSFVNDFMLFNKSIVRSILASNNYTFESFLTKSAEVIAEDCWISEFELYGNYIFKYHEHLYTIKYIKNKIIGKKAMWKDEEIVHQIKKYRNTEYKIVSFHSWM